jgi:hypothetical protein
MTTRKRTLGEEFHGLQPTTMFKTIVRGCSRYYVWITASVQRLRPLQIFLPPRLCVFIFPPLQGLVSNTWRHCGCCRPWQHRGWKGRESRVLRRSDCLLCWPIALSIALSGVACLELVVQLPVCFSRLSARAEAPPGRRSCACGAGCGAGWVEHGMVRPSRRRGRIWPVQCGACCSLCRPGLSPEPGLLAVRSQARQLQGECSGSTVGVG